MSLTHETLTPQIKGWCPTAFRPMESGDGLLVRAHTPLANITPLQLQAVARLARTYGNGLVDLTQRAQIQIRGLSPSSYPSALDLLAAAGLRASDPRSERLPHVLISPLAGFVPHGGFDAMAFSRALSAHIADIAELYALPPKFLFAVEDGHGSSLSETEADIRFSPEPDGRMAIRLGGAGETAALVPVDMAIDAGCRLAQVFQVYYASEAPAPRRMKHLVETIGAAKLFSQASLVCVPAPPGPSHPAGVDLYGLRNISGTIVVGVGAPFGRLNASEIDMIALRAADAGEDTVRLTPWRLLLFRAPGVTAAESFVDFAASAGLIVSADDPRRAIVACSGAPECSGAQGETRSALARLADIAVSLGGPDGVGVHVSGCTKGCARPAVSPVTLVATALGFDLIEEGRANDTPRLRDLAVDDAIMALTALAEDRMSCRIR
jgi:precorrin-3B synthase